MELTKRSPGIYCQSDDTKYARCSFLDSAFLVADLHCNEKS